MCFGCDSGCGPGLDSRAMAAHTIPEKDFSFIMERRILHIDMDAFFASVEVVRDPSLRGKPLIIGGRKGDVRGVVSTASYEARKFGVHSAMPLAHAVRLCPHGIFMRGDFSRYQAASEEVLAALRTVSPLVEMASIDEAYVDVSGSQKLFGGDDGIAAHIKREVRRRTQLPCSIAIASNKLVAKIATELAKPDGYLRVATGEEEAFLAPLPLRRLLGVGPRTGEALEALGIATIGQLAAFSEERLMKKFGQLGRALRCAARGESNSEVRLEHTPKSIGRETTFEVDLLDWDRVESVLMHLMERSMFAMRKQGLETRCVTLKVRYADFKTSTFSKMLPSSTCVDAEVTAALHKLLPKARTRRARVRLIGVSLSSLSADQHQLLLFDGQSAEKWEHALESVDRIRERHGFESVRSAKSMKLGKHVKLATPSLSR